MLKEKACETLSLHQRVVGPNSSSTVHPGLLQNMVFKSHEHIRDLFSKMKVRSFTKKELIRNVIAKRATPKQRARYTTAKTVIKLFNHGKTRIGQHLRIMNDRGPTRAIFFSDAKKKVGRQCILDRLHFCQRH